VADLYDDLGDSERMLTAVIPEAVTDLTRKKIRMRMDGMGAGPAPQDVISKMNGILPDVVAKVGKGRL